MPTIRNHVLFRDALLTFIVLFLVNSDCSSYYRTGRCSMYSKTVARVMLVQVNNIISLTAHMPPVHVVCIDWPYIQGPR